MGGWREVSTKNVVVTVRYIFGLSRGRDGDDTLRLELPRDATVFEALQRLGVSSLELHAAVNGESATDGTVLRDDDEITLIPAIQGGSMGGVMSTIVGMVLALGLGLVAAESASGQSRVVVPIIIQRPAATVAPAGGATSAPAPTGASRGGVGVAGAAVRSFASTPANAQSVRITVRESRGPSTGGSGVTTETRVTVRDGSGVGAVSDQRGTVRSFGSSGADDQTVRIITQETVAPRTASGTARQVDVLLEREGGALVETPIVIVPE